MGLFDRVLGWVERAARGLRTRRASKGERAFADLLPGAGFGWPGGWGANRLEQSFHWKGWKYVAGRKKAETIAGLTPQVATVEVSTSRPDDRSAFRRSYGERLLRQKQLVPLADEEDLVPVSLDHPLRALLKNPNGPDTAWSFWYKWSMNLDLTGNAYIWVIPDATGMPAELWVLPSQWVYPVVLGKGEHIVDYYELRPWGTSGGKGALRLPPDEVIHFAEPHPFNLVDGYSSLQACSEWFDTDEQVQRAQWAAFVNQCVPGLHVELGEEYVNVGDAELERIAKKFEEKHQGAIKTGKVIVTSPGAKLQGYTSTPAEMAYLESGDHTRDKCLAADGTPKEVLGLQPIGAELSWYAPMLMYCRFTIKPRLEWAGQVLTEKLAHRYDEALRLYWDDPTPDNPDQKLREVQALHAMGSITPNEVRAVYGYEPYKKGGDDPMVPRGMSVIPLNTGEHEDFNVPTAEAAREDPTLPEGEEAQAMAREGVKPQGGGNGFSRAAHLNGNGRKKR